MDQTGKLNGYKPRSYGDVIAIATLLTLFISVVAWGLKLEGEVNTLRAEVMSIKGQVGNGILPRAEERIRYLDGRQDRLEKEIEEHKH